MLRDRLKKSFLLKAISYILLPIFIISIIISGIIMLYYMEHPEIQDKKDFYDTEYFSNLYTNKIIDIYVNLKTITDSNNYYNIYDYEEYDVSSYELGEYVELQEDVENTTSGVVLELKKEKNDGIYYSSRFNGSGIKYLILNKEDNYWYTNLDRTSKTDTVEEMKQVLLSGTRYWNLKNKNVETNIEELISENIMRGSIYERMLNSDMEIYTAYIENEDKTYYADFAISKDIYNMASKYYDTATIVLPVSMVISLLLIIYLIVSCGHKKGEEGIHLDSFDKLPLELLIFFGVILGTIEGLLIFGGVGIIKYKINAFGIDLFAFGTYLAGITIIFLTLSFVKRIKTKQLIKNTILWRMLRLLKRICVKIVDTITENFQLSSKITFGFGGFILISLLLIALRDIGGIFFLPVFWLFVYIMLIRKATIILKMHKVLKDIYEGKTDTSLNEKELTGILKQMAIYINDIAGGFSNAIQESLKSERLKTELITNVSHDIRTPLTSIINYVDLLKKENIQNETAKEYVEVLDSKSQRLKKLIDDLVEASKASSGNIKLEKQLININELMKQVEGEFEDKFKEKNLEIITEYLKENKKILADNRYLFRVIENIYSNVSKYALENSRVYIDMKIIENKVEIAVKNISKERLNITKDELMQRFVRGDSSRNTEGSGLGLSIARSLTELQGGKFEIYLDGDLFKTVLEFEIKE